MAQPKPHLQLCVFDTRRGCREGQEAERVLAFYPPGTPEHVQVKTAGLAQALATFAAGFGDHAAQQGVMEGECNRWVLRQCEPSLWLLLVVSKAWATPSCPHAALQALLGDLHALFSLLHGPLEPLLQRDPTAALARACLAPFTVAAGARLGTAGWRQEAARLRNPLGPMHQMPLLRLPNAVFLGALYFIDPSQFTATCQSTAPILASQTAQGAHPPSAFGCL